MAYTYWKCIPSQLTKTAAAGADRSKAPAIGAPPELKLPKLQRATLSNGLKVILAERHEVPLVNFWLNVDAGYAADQLASPGTASMTMALLTGGTKTRTALQISDEEALLGAQLGAGLESRSFRLCGFRRSNRNSIHR